jgi:hypothetical protein
MAGGDIALCNEALRLLGQYSVVSLDEPTDQAQTVNLLFTGTKRFLLSTTPWRFTMRKVRLARVDETPASEWSRMHAMPFDPLTLRALFPSGAAGATPVRSFEIFETRILSDQDDLWADYQTEIDPDAWPAWFRQLARAALAADFAMAVGAGQSAADLWHRRAYGGPNDQMNGGLIGVARRADGQQQPPQVVRDYPLITARFGGR